MFRHMLISRKLALGFGVVIVTGLLVGGFALQQLRGIGHNVDQIERSWMPGTIALGRIAMDMNGVRRGHTLMTGAEEGRERGLKRSAERLAKMPDLFKAYEVTIITDEDQKWFAELNRRWSLYVAAGEQMAELVRAGRIDEAAALNNTTGSTTFNETEAWLQDGITLNEKGAMIESTAAAERLDAATVWIAGLLLAAIAVGVVAARLITRAVTVPLQKTMVVLEGVSRGELNQRMDVDSRDEMGRMGAALNTTIDSIRRTLDQVREAGEREQQQAAELRHNVDEILAAVNAAAHGDLTKDVPVKGDDAIGQLGRGLEKFLGDLNGSIARIAQNATALAGSSEELSAVSHQMSANAEETSAQAAVVSAASEQVNKNVEVVATGAEQMTASIKEIAKNANEAARVATQAVKVAESTNTTIAKLGESSNEIGQVVKVITSIAQQTNLLALNATIEAARAGEAGKGFAVVANEVKELAKETAKATEIISQKIEAIQADTVGAVQSMAQIGEVIAQINDISNTIASAVEEQTATTNEISRNVQEAAKGSGEIAHNNSGVAQAARSTSDGARDAQQAAGQLSGMAAELQSMVGKFKYAA